MWRHLLAATQLNLQNNEKYVQETHYVGSHTFSLALKCPPHFLNSRIATGQVMPLYDRLLLPAVVTRQVSIADKKIHTK